MKNNNEIKKQEFKEMQDRVRASIENAQRQIDMKGKQKQEQQEPKQEPKQESKPEVEYKDFVRNQIEYQRNLLAQIKEEKERKARNEFNSKLGENEIRDAIIERLVSKALRAAMIESDISALKEFLADDEILKKLNILPGNEDKARKMMHKIIKQQIIELEKQLDR